jgi:hypothetical protein
MVSCSHAVCDAVASPNILHASASLLLCALRSRGALSIISSSHASFALLWRLPHILNAAFKWLLQLDVFAKYMLCICGLVLGRCSALTLLLLLAAAG